MTKASRSNALFSPSFLGNGTAMPVHSELNVAVQKLLNTHVLISLTDTQGIIVYANEKFCAVSGYTETELLGQTHSLINSGYHTKEFIAQLWHIISKGETWHGQFCNRRKDGELYWVDSTIAPLLNEAGEPYQYLSIRRDITEQKNAELKLLTLKQGLETSNEMVLITDAKGLIEYINPAFCRLSGWFETQLLGYSPTLLNSDNTDLQTLADMRDTLKQGKMWTGRLLNRRQVIEYTFTKEPKTVDYWAAVSITPIFKANGDLSGYVQSQRDISVQVAKEENLHSEHANKSAKLDIAQILQQQKPLKIRFTEVLTRLFELKTFTSQRRGSVLITNADEKFLDMFVRLGHFSDDFIQHEQRVLIGKGICGKAAKSTEITITDTCFCDSSEEGEGNHDKIHGHYIVPMLYAGNVMGVLVLYTDTHPSQNMTRLAMLKQVGEMMALALLQEQAQLSLHAARETVAKMTDMKSEFLTNMSHEIRTPMNGILGMLDLLQDTNLTQDQSDLLDAAASSVESLLATLNDILDFSKFESHKVELEHIEFHLPVLVEDVCALLSNYATDHKIELTCFIPANFPILWQGDPTRLRQLLTNLLDNALKFTEQGEVNVRVMQIVGIDGEMQCRFEIQDTGVGMSAEQQTKLFKPFNQVDNSTASFCGGVGLGLSICKNLIDMINGAIGFESMLGQGTTFWFDLPITPALQQPPLLPSYLAGVRVLLIDDNATNRHILSHHLDAWQCFVQTENSAHAALLELEIAASNDQPYDVAIIDFQLPDMDGCELARTMTANPLLSHTPRLLLSANNFIGKNEKHSLGFSYCLSKPVRPLQLFDALWNTISLPPEQITTVKTEISYADYTDKHILLVENNVINQRVIVTELARFNLTPDVAKNSNEAINLLKNNAYDLILMDCQISIIDGYETTQQLRIHELAQAIPIIALTAENTDIERQKCLEAGMNDYLSKPFNRHSFNQMLTTWLKPTLHVPDSSESSDVPNNPASTIKVPTSTIWNETAALAQLDGDAKLFDEMVQLFLENAPTLLAQLEIHIQNDDFSAIADAANTLKSMVTHFCAKELIVKIAVLENAARENKIANFELMIDDVFHATMQLTRVLATRK